MMAGMRGRALAGAGALAVAVSASPGRAQEVTTYQYDALGRLVQSSIGGGPNNSTVVDACLDAAGNRLRYFTGSGTPSACPTPTPSPAPTPTPTPGPTPTPTPSPGPTNLAPIAVGDSTSLRCMASKTIDVVTNDCDPDGNTPLSLVSAYSDSISVNVKTATSVIITSGFPGTYSFSYVIKDALGATGVGNVSVTVTASPGTCTPTTPEG